MQGQTNSENELREYFISNRDSLNQIEGIWEVLFTEELYHYDTLHRVNREDSLRVYTVVKKNGSYKSYFSGQENAEFFPTDVKGVYLCRNFFPETGSYSLQQAVICNRGAMEYTFDIPDDVIRKNSGSKDIEGLRKVNILKWRRVFP